MIRSWSKALLTVPGEVYDAALVYAEMGTQPDALMAAPSWSRAVMVEVARLKVQARTKSTKSHK